MSKKVTVFDIDKQAYVEVHPMEADYMLRQCYATYTEEEARELLNG